jgi:hypothetical protein
MKKNENKKFCLEKFEVAKLNNPKMIRGGDSSGICTTTNDNPNSTENCQTQNPQPTRPQQPKDKTVVTVGN